MDRPLVYSLVAHCFGFFWNSQFLLGFTSCVAAHVTYTCYWQLAAEAVPPPPADEDEDEGGNEPAAAAAPPPWYLHRAAWVVARFYFGSVALGSFLAAWVQFFRLLLQHAAGRLQETVERGTAPGCVLALAGFLQRALLLLVRLLGAQAYCMVLLSGKGFCDAGVYAVSVSVANFDNVAAVTVITDVILTMGKLAVAACSAFSCFLYLDTLPAGSVSSPLLPVILVGATAFVIASLFFAVPELVVETIILAFCKDLVESGGQSAPPALQACLATHRDAAAQRAGCCVGGAAADDEAPDSPAGGGAATAKIPSSRV